MSPQLHSSGFRVLSRPIAASFAHPFSFKLLAPHEISDESCIPATVAVGGKEEGWSKYWDETAFAAELAFKVAPVVKEAEKSKEKKKEKHKESSSKSKFSRWASLLFLISTFAFRARCGLTSHRWCTDGSSF